MGYLDQAVLEGLCLAAAILACIGFAFAINWLGSRKDRNPDSAAGLVQIVVTLAFVGALSALGSACGLR